MSENTEWFEGRNTNEQPRLTVLPWLIWFLVIVVAIAAALNAGRVIADESEPMIVRRGADYIRITHGVCTPNLPGFQTGNAILDGRPYKLCWKLIPEGENPMHILAVFDDGDTWRINPAAFKPESKNPAGL